jgi:GNAT superfamily N-acetyltransferase
VERAKYDETIKDQSGEKIRIRAIRPTDKEGLRQLFQMMSPRSVYSRFLYRKKEVSPAELKYFTELDFETHVALVATVENGGKEEIVGVGRYIVDEEGDDPTCAEIAFAVADEHQKHGIGQALLKRLALLAEDAGIKRFESLVHEDDAPLLQLLEHSGFAVAETTNFGRIRVSLDLKAHRKPKSRVR